MHASCLATSDIFFVVVVAIMRWDASHRMRECTYSISRGCTLYMYQITHTWLGDTQRHKTQATATSIFGYSERASVVSSEYDFAYASTTGTQTVKHMRDIFEGLDKRTHTGELCLRSWRKYVCLYGHTYATQTDTQNIEIIDQ